MATVLTNFSEMENDNLKPGQLNFLGNVLTDLELICKKDLFTRLQRIECQLFNFDTSCITAENLVEFKKSESDSLFVTHWTPYKKFLLFATTLYVPDANWVSGFIDIECVPDDYTNFQKMTFEEFIQLPIMPVDFDFNEEVYKGYVQGNQFQGTLMTGEMNYSYSKGIPLFAIQDVYFMCGVDLTGFPLIKRQREYIDGFIDHECGWYLPNDNDIILLDTKKWYECNELQTLLNELNQQDYLVEHLLFVNVDTLQHWLYSIPQVKQDGLLPTPNQPPFIQQPTLIHPNTVGTNCTNCTNCSRNYPVAQIPQKTCKQFTLRGSSNPEIYFIYHLNSDKRVEPNSIAHIDSMECSRFVKSLFDQFDRNTETNSNSSNGSNNRRQITCWCEYNPDTSKWTPVPEN